MDDKGAQGSRLKCFGSKTEWRELAERKGESHQLVPRKVTIVKCQHRGARGARSPPVTQHRLLSPKRLTLMPINIISGKLDSNKHLIFVSSLLGVLQF